MEKFRTAATEFCELIESSDSFKREDFLKRLAPLLARLHLGAMQLEMPPDFSDTFIDLPSVDTNIISQNLTVVFSDLNRYRMAFHPQVNKTGQEEGSLVEDLVDIYEEVKAGLLKLSAEALPQPVEWHWAYSYWLHWGRHLVDAMRIIHLERASRELSKPNLT